MKTIHPITKSHSGLKAALVPLALLGGACMGHAANLLTDPGFETQGTLFSFGGVVNSPNFSTTAGNWGAENGAFVGAENGVVPLGTRMLRMMDDGGTTTSTIQMISLSAYASAINSGNATFNMSALFNSDADRGAPTAAINATFFAGDFSWPSGIGSGFTSAGTLDTNPNTWQTLSGGGTIPVGAEWVGVQVYFGNAALGGFNGYVDANSETTGFTVTTIPEPSGTILLGLGSGLLFVRRRRMTR
jgi:hypothetical protein